MEKCYSFMHMKIELIPVLDICYTYQDVTWPAGGDAADKDAYQAACLQRAGFTDLMEPYLSGTTFYQVVNISDANLTRWLLDHTRAYREGEYERDNVSPFFGGYVLKVDAEDKYFPQCCSNLADIRFWNGLADLKILPAEGHPSPAIHIQDDNIVFEFKDEDESFYPLPPELILKVSRNELVVALENLQETLQVFQERIERINVVENLQLENIDELLIWGNKVHADQ